MSRGIEQVDEKSQVDRIAPEQTTEVPVPDLENGDKTTPALERIESARSNVFDDLAKGEGVSYTDLPIIEYSEEENRRVLRKLDMVLLPLTMIAYTLQYIDRSAMSYAAVFTFRKDLHLKGDDYSWLGSLFFFGYLFFEFPGSYLLQRLPLSKTMGSSIFIWGGLLMCMAAPRQFGGAAAIRFLLGCAEALVTPGFVLLVSRFYKREEQPLRVGLWYCCNGAGSFIGALVSYGMGHVSVNGVPEWAWIFIFNGGITVLFALIFLWLCPENPQTCRFLNAHEKRIALERVRGNKASLGSKKVKWYQVKEALCPWIDPQGWAYVIIVFTLALPNGGIGNFLHLILQSYGYTAFQTILIGLPQAAMQVVFPLSGAIIARKVPGARLYVLMAYMIPSLVGVIIQYKTRNSGALLFGYYILGSYVAALGVCFAAPGANVAGTTKRVVIGAMIFISYATGNIIGPHFFIATEVPAYKSGMLACMICFAITIPIGFLLRLYYTRENKRRDRLAAESGEEVDANGGDFSDKTDIENLSFRYAL
ncbi:allantoate permease [Kwoniella heveanensis CBS 569]|nr:allantoate permease [Kwoniella heveanensis CBS 569]